MNTCFSRSLGSIRYAPGERTSCVTTTRSVPLMTNVPALGHPREVAHEDGLLADLARLAVDERDGDRQRASVGEILLATLLERGDRFVEHELTELDGEVAGVVLDRRDVVDRLA